MLPPDAITPWLERALDLSAHRGALLSANLANVDTPGYTPSDLDFEAHLRDELRHRGHIGPSHTQPSGRLRFDTEPSLDGNRVDLDTEMTLAAANRTFYQLTTEVLNRNLGLLRYAIDEGGR
ncbi:MAG: flagellar basal body rod protein FlgB [Myxococcota bacterium]